jgi:hypothetical protein
MAGEATVVFGVLAQRGWSCQVFCDLDLDEAAAFNCSPRGKSLASDAHLRRRQKLAAIDVGFEPDLRSNSRREAWCYGAVDLPTTATRMPGWGIWAPSTQVAWQAPSECLARWDPFCVGRRSRAQQPQQASGAAGP